MNKALVISFGNIEVHFNHEAMYEINDKEKDVFINNASLGVVVGFLLANGWQGEYIELMQLYDDKNVKIQPTPLYTIQNNWFPLR